MAIITWTVFFTGGSTKIVLDLLHKWWPKDKIYRGSEEEEASSAEASFDFEYGDFLEEEEGNRAVLEGFLIKGQTMDQIDPYGERYIDQGDVRTLYFRPCRFKSFGYFFIAFLIPF